VEVKPDLTGTGDVTFLVQEFYKKATVDPLIGTFFMEVVKLDWDKHVPLIVSFWDSLLFGRGSYSGNFLEAHLHLDRLKKIEPAHLDRWFSLWEQTVNDHFSGSKAEEAVSRAKNILEVMRYKLSQQ
jgi:hemoglobin